MSHGGHTHVRLLVALPPVHSRSFRLPLHKGGGHELQCVFETHRDGTTSTHKTHEQRAKRYGQVMPV